MAIYVYITQNCRDKAITYGLHQEMDRFTARVEKVQSLELFANFPHPYLVKRKFGGNQGRLIAEKTKLGGAEEHTIVCFLTVLIRGDRDYDRGFGVDPVGWGRTHLQGLYTEAELEEWLLGRLEKSVPEPPPPSEAESRFLHAVTNAATGEDDWTIAEKREWVRKVQQKDVVPHLGPLFEALNEVVRGARTGGQRRGIQPAGSTWSVQWSAYPDQKLLVLEDVVPASLKAAPAEPAPELSRAEILRTCRHAYLDIVSADQAQWLAIQEDSEGNLALSPEEEEVIESTRPGNTPAFPLFINGRAGSGKSTVLQYLFADYLMTYIELLESGGLEEQTGAAAQGAPEAQGVAYFTCSKDLLANAKAAVETILQNGAQFWDKPQRKELIARRRQDIEGAFRELRSYLLSLVPKPDRKRFDERNYVSYPRYQRLWAEKFSRDPAAAKQYGAALSWHVIRTHIKGASSDDILDPEEYELLDRKQRTVSSEDYRLIYDKVWDRWYRRKCEGERLWDDQDLARHLLEHDLVRPVFYAIFCDESQDFTSVELQAILRLSVFSRRKLRNDEVCRVPFVFAGDPFQTLNPTGFRWESTKASYFKNFVLSLNPWGDQDTSLNYKELSQNYRSSKSIVGFCNLIQARRAHLFQIKTVQPQETWSDEDAPLPVYWFRADDGRFWDEFSRQKDLVLITPCPEGGEAQYVCEDPLLKSRIPVKEDTPENVWSAIRSKGLEFDRVVLYGFGSAEDARQVCRLKPPEAGEDAARRLPAEYFFNKLYVAASRAKHALYVVDTSDGLVGFWSFACLQPLDEWLNSAPGGAERWKGHVEHMVGGEPEVLRTGHYDPVKIAGELEKQGVSTENAFIMRQAAVHYRHADNHNAAEYCETKALLFEEKYAEAARAFFKQKRWDEGVRACWLDGASGRRELFREGIREREVRTKLEWRMAAALEDKTADPGKWIELLDDVVRNAKHERAQWTPNQRKGWSDAILGAVSKMASARRDLAVPAQWLELLSRIEELKKLDLCVDASLDRAILSARARQYQAARDLFRQAGIEEDNPDNQPDEFVETLAECLPFPKNLRALERLNRRAAIIHQWETARHAALEPPDALIVAQTLIHEGREAEALPLVARMRRADLARKCADKLAARGDLDSARRAMLCAILLLSGAEKLDELVRMPNWPLRCQDGDRTWGSVLGDLLAPFVARAVAGGDAVGDAHTGPRLAGLLKPGWGALNPSSEQEVRLWGAAVERTGQINTTIEFYTSLLARCPVEAPYESLRLWIRGRMLKAKWRRTLTRRAQMHKETAASDQIGLRNEFEKWNLGTPESLPEFAEKISVQKAIEDLLTGQSGAAKVSPEAPEAAPPALPPVPEIQKVEFLGFEFQSNRSRKRLTITRPPDDNRVRIEHGDGWKCASDLTAEENGEANWFIPEWRIRLSVNETGGRVQAVVTWPEQMVELRLDFPS